MVETVVMAENRDEGKVLGPPAPPKAFQKPLNDVFNRCAKNFKKVTWPPTPEPPPKEVSPPPELELLDDVPLNEDAMFQKNAAYKLVPTVYSEEPDNFGGDIWPPNLPPNLDERVIYDAARPQKVIRDYEVVVPVNEAHPVHKSYKVAPGTLHVHSNLSGHLVYNTPDLGGAKYAPPPK